MSPVLLAELCVPARSEQLAAVRESVRSAVRLAGLHGDALDNIVLAINEACMNVIQHGYRFADGHELLLRVWQEPGLLVFELFDHAAPVKPETVKPRPLDDIRPGGLGVHFIRSIMDDMTFMPPPAGYGNFLRMTKRIEPHGSGHGV